MVSSILRTLSPDQLVRPLLRRLEPYVPGEQPNIRGLVKLNTNENPYGPAPKVLRAIQRATDKRLRLYPNPTADPLRARLARFHGCGVENLIVGNGSDELLALATRAFVEPLTGLTHYALQTAALSGPRPSRTGASKHGTEEVEEALAPSRYTVQFLSPSYSLYPVLAAMHGARAKPVPLHDDFSLPSRSELEERNWDFQAALTFITTPNAPSGRGYRRAELEGICREHHGVIVLDEAYVNFGGEDALEIALKFPHVLVARTFSKAYSLCFLRVGYLVGHPSLIAALHKIRDSYNVNGLGQVAAEAAIDSSSYYEARFRQIIRTRERLSKHLSALGFNVFPSQTNFILVRPPCDTAEWWMQQLRDRKILVRWFSAPPVRDFLRITIGTDEEMKKLLTAVRGVLETLAS